MATRKLDVSFLDVSDLAEDEVQRLENLLHSCEPNCFAFSWVEESDVKCDLEEEEAVVDEEDTVPDSESDQEGKYDDVAPEVLPANKNEVGNESFSTEDAPNYNSTVYDEVVPCVSHPNVPIPPQHEDQSLIAITTDGAMINQPPAIQQFVPFMHPAYIHPPATSSPHPQARMFPVPIPQVPHMYVDKVTTNISVHHSFPYQGYQYTPVTPTDQENKPDHHPAYPLQYPQNKNSSRKPKSRRSSSSYDYGSKGSEPVLNSAPPAMIPAPQTFLPGMVYQAAPYPTTHHPLPYPATPQAATGSPLVMNPSVPPFVPFPPATVYPAPAVPPEAVVQQDFVKHVGDQYVPGSVGITKNLAPLQDNQASGTTPSHVNEASETKQSHVNEASGTTQSHVNEASGTTQSHVNKGSGTTVLNVNECSESTTVDSSGCVDVHKSETTKTVNNLDVNKIDSNDSSCAEKVLDTKSMTVVHTSLGDINDSKKLHSVPVLGTSDIGKNVVLNEENRNVPTSRHESKTDSKDEVKSNVASPSSSAELPKKTQEASRGPPSSSSDSSKKVVEDSNASKKVAVSTDSSNVIHTQTFTPSSNRIKENDAAKVLPDVKPAQVPLPAPVTLASAWESSKNWASLFKSSSSDSRPIAKVAPVSATTENIVKKEVEKEPAKMSCIVDEQLHKLGAFMSDYQLSHQAPNLQPRGLANRGYWCYINATLQALVACPPFYNLMKSIPLVSGLKASDLKTPIMDSMVEFVNEFSPMTQSSWQSRKGNRKEDLQTGQPFEPVYVYKMLKSVTGEVFKDEGSQQDAEEFLSCILNHLNEEMIEIMKMSGLHRGEKPMENGTMNGVIENGDVQNGEEEEWQVMGRKNKSCITRSAQFVRTPISDTFLGQMRSALHQPGMQVKSTDTLQPFFSLPLDIQNEKITSVKDALNALVCKESIDGFTCTRTGQEVSASRRITLEELPPVLILHMKRFLYDASGGCQKLLKKVDFSMEMDISKDAISTTSKSKLGLRQRQYKLFAVVYHDGREANKGHYITDCYHAGYGGWLRYDDDTVKLVSESSLSKQTPQRVPYLLMYRRTDTVPSSTNKKHS